MSLLPSSPRRPLLALTAVPALLALVATAAPAAAQSPRDFDLQAHRGGLALTVENTLPAFANALELGVSTLELDVQITEDQQAVVTHDRQISATKCQDTGPATPGDPEFPYVGDYVHTLTLAQVRTLDCGSQRHPAHPEQELAPGEPMPLLSEVFDLVRAYKARQVTFNIETKVEAGAPHETAPREQFVQVVADLVMRAKVARHVTIQSFDWGALMRMQEVAPKLPVVALTNGQQFLQAGQPGASPWLGGIDIDDFMTEGRSLQEAYVVAAASFGADAVSPVHGTPQGGSVADAGYVPFTTPELVDAAHAAGMDVVPWTVNDRPTMEHLIGIGVDGLITDRPDLLREILAERGFRLPRAYQPPRTGRS
ncbi:glycerophosphodiester phosphodiesterase family protein [Blastococcus sp. SYSU DS0616]